MYKDVVFRYKKLIDFVFTDTSIYKSIIVCHDIHTSRPLFKSLKNDLYPITDIRNYITFLTSAARTIILDCVDFKNIDKLFDENILNSINAIFFIGCNSAIPDILNSVHVKKYVFKIK
jgi:hypothetical protein